MIKKRGNPLILFFFLVLIISIISGFFFEQKNENDFQNGTYNNTFWNSSGFIQVNQSQLDNEPEEISGVEEGLISYWRFNENSWNGTSGEVKDFLGKNNGTSVSGANTTEGLFERSGGFDGIDDYVRIPNSEEINPGMGSFTITGYSH